jgi:hypothetical protein
MIHGVQGRRWIMAELLATRASRGHRTLCLPIAEESYEQIVSSPAAFRRTLDDWFRGGVLGGVANRTEIGLVGLTV